jgi:iron(III) transport system substrate-binding protein
VKPGAPIDPIIAKLGTLTVDPLSLADIARQRGVASKLVDKVGFDN